MKRNLSDYFVALFVIVCSVVLLGALTFALSGRQLKKPTRTLQINYEDVTGIKVNSEVRYAGAPAGRVIAMRHLTAQEREATANKNDAVRVTVRRSQTTRRSKAIPHTGWSKSLRQPVRCSITQTKCSPIWTLLSPI